MNRNKLGKLVLSFVLVVGAVVSTAVDWNTTHLFNPAWHPHARFHDALFLLFLDAMSLVVLWLLWRPSKEPEVAIKVAALFSAAVWTPFFRNRTDVKPACSPIELLLGRLISDNNFKSLKKSARNIEQQPHQPGERI